MFILQTVIEFAIAGFIIWGLFNENKLVDFEDKIIAKIKSRRAARKANVYTRNTAVRENKPELVTLLLENGAKVDALSTSSVSPLMVAAWSGFDALVEQLLSAGADAELQDDDGSSAATYARELHDDETREKILKLLGS